MNFAMMQSIFSLANIFTLTRFVLFVFHHIFDVKYMSACRTFGSSQPAKFLADVS